MITSLKIEHFKSIEDLDIECSRINIFIGDPNTGKSNILESLGVLSFCGSLIPGNQGIQEFVRFQYLADLFTDGSLDRDVKISIKNKTDAGVIYDSILIKPESSEYKFFKDTYNETDKEKWDNTVPHIAPKQNIGPTSQSVGSLPLVITLRNNGQFSKQGDYQKSKLRNFHPIKFYRFHEQVDFNDQSTDEFKPPYGRNLVHFINAHKKLQEMVGNILKDEGYRLLLKPWENKIEIIRDSDFISRAFPYFLMSDTLQRIIFYLITIRSNENATLVFEEPESHSFPYYTKNLGEIIALDKKNQYFIATHNPYLLYAIISKAPKEDVNVFITFMDKKKYQTKVKKLEFDSVTELLKSDPFLNLHIFLDEDKG